MTLPTFYILGAAKCGTTSLHDYLGRHPDICMSAPKEPFFFEAEFDKGADYYAKTYFGHCSNERHIGDARHQNLVLPYIAGRIARLTPDAKLLLLARNPVERAWSHWWHWHSRGIETTSFEAAIDRDFARLRDGPRFDDPAEAKLYAERLDFNTGYSPFEPYVEAGHYADHIDRYAALFGRDRIKVLFFEDLVAQAQSVVDEVTDFLGAARLALDEARPLNRSLSPAGITAVNWLGALPIARLVPRSVRRRIRNFLADKIFPATPAISPDLAQQLAVHYELYNRRLELLTGRDLSGWDRPLRKAGVNEANSNAVHSTDSGGRLP